MPDELLTIERVAVLHRVALFSAVPGHTLLAVKHWCEDQGAADVRIAVMTVKRHDRCVEGIEADYVGLEVPDAYVFGHGMDFHEQGRNLPDIHAMRS